MVVAPHGTNYDVSPATNGRSFCWPSEKRSRNISKNPRVGQDDCYSYSSSRVGQQWQETRPYPSQYRSRGSGSYDYPLCANHDGPAMNDSNILIHPDPAKAG